MAATAQASSGDNEGTGCLKPEIEPQSLDPEYRMEAERTLKTFSELPMEVREVLRKRVDESFAEMLSGLPASFHVGSAALRPSWLRKHYFGIMKSVQSEWVERQRGRCFVPELLPEEVPVDQRGEAQELAATFPKGAEELLRGRIDEAFESACNALPKTMMLSRRELRAAWLRAEYYRVLKAVKDEFSVSQARENSTSCNKRQFVPDIDVEEVPVARREHVQRLVAKFPTEAAGLLRERVDAAFDASFENVPECLRGSEAAMRAAWMRAEYFAVMENVLEAWELARPRGARVFFSGSGACAAPVGGTETRGADVGELPRGGAGDAGGACVAGIRGYVGEGQCVRCRSFEK